MQSAALKTSGPWALSGLCIGFLSLGSLLPRDSVQRLEPGVLRLEPARGTPIDAMNLRQLRALPAIGHGRALSILEARAKAHGNLEIDSPGASRRSSSLWMEAPGIGPITRAKLERWLAEDLPRGNAPGGLESKLNAEGRSN